MKLSLSGAATAAEHPIRHSTPLARSSAVEQEVMLLYDEMRAPLLRYVSSFGLLPCDAEEVVQEVFLALFQHLRGGKPRQNLKGWLFRVAHNLGLRKRRDDGRERQYVDFSLTEWEDVAVDPDLNPEDQLAQSRSWQALAAVVSALPPADRRCLCLRAEGLRYRQIARILEVSISSVSVSLARSLARISRVAGR